MTATNHTITRPKLGEELPVFCERCGYSLNALPQLRCEHCEILQFKCPECGHHQPINTLRPAFQLFLGRIRATFMVGSILIRLAFFAVCLIAFAAGGSESAYTYNDASQQQLTTSAGTTYVQVAPHRIPAKLDTPTYVAFTITGFIFGVIGRMLLLRWRHGLLVGACLALIVAMAIACGASIDWLDSRAGKFPYQNPFTIQFNEAMLTAAVAVSVAASLSWIIWYALVKALLPQKAGAALLAWQRAMSDRSSKNDHTAAAFSRDGAST